MPPTVAPHYLPLSEHVATRRVYVPDYKVYRSGHVYYYRDAGESLSAAVASFLTAHYRIAHRRVVRFDDLWLASKLHESPRQQWQRAITYLAEIGVPPHDDFKPNAIGNIARALEVVHALNEYGPVLLYLPWSAAYEEVSKSKGVEWVGADGSELMGSATNNFRGVLVKGVSSRYNAVRVQDGRHGREDLWFPLAELDRAFGAGAHAITALY